MFFFARSIVSPMNFVQSSTHILLYSAEFWKKKKPKRIRRNGRLNATQIYDFDKKCFRIASSLFVWLCAPQISQNILHLFQCLCFEKFGIQVARPILWICLMQIVRKVLGRDKNALSGFFGLAMHDSDQTPNPIEMEILTQCSFSLNKVHTRIYYFHHLIQLVVRVQTDWIHQWISSINISKRLLLCQ